MKDYTVTITETARYECVVKARSKYEACKKAEALFLKGIALDAPFATEILDRDIEAEKAGRQ